MTATETLATPYSFPVSTENSHAVLVIGRRYCKVEVVNYSWAGFSVLVSKKSRRRLKAGSRAVIVHSGSTHTVTIGDLRKVDATQFELQLNRADDANPYSSDRSRNKARSSNVRVIERDPILAPAFGLAVVVLLVATPGWGNEWGTSAMFSDGVKTLCDAIFGMIHVVTS